MTAAEKKVWDFIQKHTELLIVIIGAAASLCIRYALMDFVSDDMRVYLLPWYEEIRQSGGLKALSAQVGEYNIPYQILISIATCLPVQPVHAYKIISVIFDYLLGAAAARTVWLVTDRNRLKTAFAFAVAVNLPMVFLNSAMWGQCDSIYTFFCVLSVLFLLERKSTLCFVAYGAACAFKLQAVFLLPFLLFAYGKDRQFSIWKIVLVPLTMIACSLPAIVQGRPVADVFLIYGSQTGIYRQMALNYPSFWSLMMPNLDGRYYGYFMAPAIILTLCILLTETILFLKKDGSGTMRERLMQCFLLSYTCVVFLPAMHERYDYLPLVMGLILVFAEPKTAVLYLGLCILNIKAYSDFLLKNPQPWDVLSVMNVLIFTGYAIFVYRRTCLAGIPRELRRGRPDAFIDKHRGE